MKPVRPPKKKQTPAIKTTAPLTAKKSATPMTAKKSATPMSVKKSATPMSVKKSATPMSAKKSATPFFENKNTTPLFGNKNATPSSANKNATPSSVKITNVSTGIKYKDQEVFHTPDLKNPLSGFYTKNADGKRQKIVLAAIDTNIANSLKATLKTKNATPPPGKTVNPKTGRFVKQVADKEVEKDPNAC